MMTFERRDELWIKFLDGNLTDAEDGELYHLLFGGLQTELPMMEDVEILGMLDAWGRTNISKSHFASEVMRRIKAGDDPRTATAAQTWDEVETGWDETTAGPPPAAPPIVRHELPAPSDADELSRELQLNQATAARVSPTPRVAKPQRTTKALVLAGIALVVILVAYLLWSLLSTTEPTDQPRDSKTAKREQPIDRPLATANQLIRIRAHEDQTPAWVGDKPGNSIVGQRLQLAQGSVLATSASGARLSIQAPATFKFRSSVLLELISGTIHVDNAKAVAPMAIVASEFRAAGDQAFQVHSDRFGSSVRVLQGKVNVKHDDRPSELTDGQYRRIEKTGEQLGWYVIGTRTLGDNGNPSKENPSDDKQSATEQPAIQQLTWSINGKLIAADQLPVAAGEFLKQLSDRQDDAQQLAGGLRVDNRLQIFPAGDDQSDAIGALRSALGIATPPTPEQ